MKLAVLLLTLIVSCWSVKSEKMESTNSLTSDELLKRAALQLERLSAFRRTREPQETIPEVAPENKVSYARPAGIETQAEIVEAQKRIDDLRASASAVLRDPRYAEIMQDRIKRSFISGIANQLIGGAVGAVSGLSRGVSGLSSSNTHDHYGHYGHSYESQFSIWDFKKAIINTLIQAIKAIGGGAIAGGGALIKGGGYLVTAKGRIISSAGDAITSLGKSLASSAIIASPKPIYGPPGYAYNHHPIQHPGLDHVYDGPPPSEDAYIGPEDAYNAGHSSYTSPSNDDSGDDDTGVLVVKETKPGHEPEEEHPPESNAADTNTNLEALEESFGGPPKGPSTVTKIIGILNSGQPTASEQHDDERGQYYSSQNDHHSVSQDSPLTSSESLPPHQDHRENGNNANYQDYQTNGQVYDSYGIKLEPTSPQLTDVHKDKTQPNQDNHHSLGFNIQGVLSPNLEVPQNQNPMAFKDSTPFGNFQYNLNQLYTDPIKTSFPDNHNNHLDHTSQDQQSIGIPDYYGVPHYSYGAHDINTMIGVNGHASSLPLLPNYGNYQLNSPMGFGPNIHYPATTGPAVLGVWGRMTRRSGHGNKAAFSNNGLQIQRSVGYRLINSKLTRI